MTSAQQDLQQVLEDARKGGNLAFVSPFLAVALTQMAAHIDDLTRRVYDLTPPELHESMPDEHARRAERPAKAALPRTQEERMVYHTDDYVEQVIEATGAGFVTVDAYQLPVYEAFRALAHQQRVTQAKVEALYRLVEMSPQNPNATGMPADLSVREATSAEIAGFVPDAAVEAERQAQQAYNEQIVAGKQLHPCDWEYCLAHGTPHGDYKRGYWPTVVSYTTAMRYYCSVQCMIQGALEEQLSN